jgi:hypothetical protein
VYSLPVDSSGRPGTLRQIVDVPGGAYAVALDAGGCAYFSDATSVQRIEDGRCR